MARGGRKCYTVGMKRIYCSFSLCVSAFALLCAAAPLCGAAEVAEKARPFAPQDVALGEGPFRRAYETNREYLLDTVSADRLLAGFREEAKLPKKADRYRGWEGAEITGHSLGHYLTALSLLYAQETGDAKARAKERIDYIVEELAACQKANGDGYLHTCRRAVYESIRNHTFTTGGFDISKCWVPNYTLHKILAGLRDAYRIAGNRKALEVERGMADFYYGAVSGLDDAERQRLLVSEWGGLNEVFAQLSADARDEKYMRLATDWFNDRRVFDPLRRGEDRLDGLHANTQVPKVTGLATIYEMTGDERTHLAIDTFWDSVVNRRSFANGGHSDAEHFYNVALTPKKLGKDNSETCNINNMIRLTGRMFSWEPDSKRMDFVERALINQLLTQIGRRPGEFGYFLSQKPVAFKTWSTPTGAWWCCVGTGMENPVRYTEQVYYHDDGALWVNLYMASTLNWREKGVVVEQTTRFPEEDKVRFSVRTADRKPVRFALRLRRPYWCPGMRASIKGEPGKDGYVAIDREWRDGDSLELELPMSLRLEALPHSDGKFAAFMYGPMVLVGVNPAKAGEKDLAKERWDNHLASPGGTEENAKTIVSDGGDATARVVREKGALRWRTNGLLKPDDLTLMPFHQVYEEHYTVYFPVMTSEEWRSEKEKLAAAEKLKAHMATLVTDTVEPGFQQSEVNHSYAGEFSEVGDFKDRKYRHASGEKGCIGYTMDVDAKVRMELVVTYFGGDAGRSFDIFVDGEKLVTTTLAFKGGERGRFNDVVYVLPLSRTQGKKSVRVEFRGNKATSWVGGLFGLTMRRSEGALLDGETLGETAP